jgi:hypothetical protein
MALQGQAPSDLMYNTSPFPSEEVPTRKQANIPSDWLPDIHLSRELSTKSLDFK